MGGRLGSALVAGLLGLAAVGVAGPAVTPAAALAYDPPTAHGVTTRLRTSAREQIQLAYASDDGRWKLVTRPVSSTAAPWGVLDPTGRFTALSPGSYVRAIGYDVGDDGRVVGSVADAQGQERPAVWASPGAAPQLLPPVPSTSPPVEYRTEAYAATQVLADGRVLVTVPDLILGATYNGQFHSFVWDGTAYTPLQDLTGGALGGATEVSRNGVYLVEAVTISGGVSPSDEFVQIWRAGAPLVRLQSATTARLTSDGVPVGAARGGGGLVPTRWDALGGRHDLALPPGDTGGEVTDGAAGTYVGVTCSTFSGCHAVRWGADGSPVVLDAALPGDSIVAPTGESDRYVQPVPAVRLDGSGGVYVKLRKGYGSVQGQPVTARWRPVSGAPALVVDVNGVARPLAGAVLTTAAATVRVQPSDAIRQVAFDAVWPGGAAAKVDTTPPFTLDLSLPTDGLRSLTATTTDYEGTSVTLRAAFETRRTFPGPVRLSADGPSSATLRWPGVPGATAYAITCAAGAAKPLPATARAASCTGTPGHPLDAKVTATGSGGATLGAASGRALLPSSTSTESLLYSRFADRSSPEPLQGAELAGPVYVFSTLAGTFDLDGGLISRTESTAPYDLVRTAPAGTAVPLDTRELADGSHTLGLRSAGGTVAASFRTVNQDSGQTGVVKALRRTGGSSPLVLLDLSPNRQWQLLQERVDQGPYVRRFRSGPSGTQELVEVSGDATMLDIGDDGTVVGFQGFGTAVRWLPGSASPQAVPAPPFDASGAARAVASQALPGGRLLVSSEDDYNEPNLQSAFWDGTTFTTLLSATGGALTGGTEVAADGDILENRHIQTYEYPSGTTDEYTAWAWHKGQTRAVQLQGATRAIMSPNGNPIGVWQRTAPVRGVPAQWDDSGTPHALRLPAGTVSGAATDSGGKGTIVGYACTIVQSCTAVRWVNGVPTTVNLVPAGTHLSTVAGTFSLRADPVYRQLRLDGSGGIFAGVSTDDGAGSYTVHWTSPAAG